jgi:hypothetical protein
VRKSDNGFQKLRNLWACLSGYLTGLQFGKMQCQIVQATELTDNEVRENVFPYFGNKTWFIWFLIDVLKPDGHFRYTIVISGMQPASFLLKKIQNFSKRREKGPVRTIPDNQE